MPESAPFEILLTGEAQKHYDTLDDPMTRRINAAIDLLSRNPFLVSCPGNTLTISRNHVAQPPPAVPRMGGSRAAHTTATYARYFRDSTLGPNIAKLRGKLEGLYRCRVGSYRIVYAVDDRRRLITVHGILRRPEAYR